MRSYRPTWAEIDLDAIRYNLRMTRKLVGESVKILGVVKADAYGHGVEGVSKAIVDDVDYFGVASLDEAGFLRKVGIRKPIIVLGTILPEEADGVLEFDVIQTISDIDIAERLSMLGRSRHKNVKVHIKIDTGMGRIGFWHKDSLQVVKSIHRLKNIEIEGIYTHFPNAEEDRSFTNMQIRNFKALIKTLEGQGIFIKLRHMANSMGIIDFKDSHMNMVRPGLMMYGIYPRSDLMSRIKLKPALMLKTKITFIKGVPEGRTISYGSTYVTPKPTKIATIPIGYGDGYPRDLSNKGEVLIKGRRAPIVGRVCMDMCMIDVGHIENLKKGDEVVLIGRQGKDRISVEDVASLIGTIPYEIVCNIGRRVPRLFVYKKY